jgi:hypothetical protein
MSMTTVRLKSNNGSTEANVDCVSYAADVNGVFHVTSDVARKLLDVPAGFALAPESSPTPRYTYMDFLALDANGNPQPGAQFEVGVGGRHVADEHGIITNVLPNHASNLLSAGAIPLTPAGWVDPRPAPVAA